MASWFKQHLDNFVGQLAAITTTTETTTPKAIETKKPDNETEEEDFGFVFLELEDKVQAMEKKKLEDQKAREERVQLYKETQAYKEANAYRKQLIEQEKQTILDSFKNGTTGTSKLVFKN